MKVGVGIADLMSGMYAAVAILAALRHRDATGEGQHIDLALLDTQVAWLVNVGTNYLLSGPGAAPAGQRAPEHRALPDVRRARDGYVILAVGNDGQFRKWCALRRLPPSSRRTRASPPTACGSRIGASCTR